MGHGERSAQAPAIRHPDGSHRIVLALLVGILWPVLAAAQAPPQLDVEGVLLTAIAAVEVPAQEPGVLVAVEVREGRTVSEDTLLARIADKDAQIALARAEVELQMARKKVANDVNIRFARKSAEVAKAELQRTHESRQLYAKSISDSEVDRLRLIAERATLEVEQAEYEFAMATLLLQTKENDVATAAEELRRRRIAAPTSGMVVEVRRRAGEWVQTGEAVVRIVRLDRLRAEGFLAAALVDHRTVGAAAKLVVDLPEQPGATFPAKVTFVGPEVNPINGQVRVWAEAENPNLALRPGMRAKLIIEKPAAPKEPPSP